MSEVPPTYVSKRWMKILPPPVEDQPINTPEVSLYKDIFINDRNNLINRIQPYIGEIKDYYIYTDYTSFYELSDGKGNHIIVADTLIYKGIKKEGKLDGIVEIYSLEHNKKVRCLYREGVKQVNEIINGDITSYTFKWDRRTIEKNVNTNKYLVKLANIVIYEHRGEYIEDKSIYFLFFSIKAFQTF